MTIRLSKSPTYYRNNNIKKFLIAIKEQVKPHELSLYRQNFISYRFELNY